jgi:hypothetical protein
MIRYRENASDEEDADESEKRVLANVVDQRHGLASRRWPFGRRLDESSAACVECRFFSCYVTGLSILLRKVDRSGDQGETKNDIYGILAWHRTLLPQQRLSGHLLWLVEALKKWTLNQHSSQAHHHKGHPSEQGERKRGRTRTSRTVGATSARQAFPSSSMKPRPLLSFPVMMKGTGLVVWAV